MRQDESAAGNESGRQVAWIVSIFIIVLFANTIRLMIRPPTPKSLMYGMQFLNLHLMVLYASPFVRPKRARRALFGVAMAALALSFAMLLSMKTMGG